MSELTNRLSSSVEAFNNACAELSQYADTLGYPPSLKSTQAQHVKAAYEIAFLGEDALNYIRQLEAERANLRDMKQESDIRSEFLDRVVSVAQKHGFQNNGWLDSIDFLDGSMSTFAREFNRVKARDERESAAYDALADQLRDARQESAKLAEDSRYRSQQMLAAMDVLGAQTWEGFMYRLHELKAENQRLQDAQRAAYGHAQVEYYLINKSLANAKDIVPPDEFGYGLFPRVDAMIAMLRAQAHPAPESANDDR